MTEYERINRRFEKLFFNRVSKVLKKDMAEFISVFREGGIQAVRNKLELTNPELAKEIERLYVTVGLRHANESMRNLRRLERKGFGFNEAWVRFIQEYLREHLISKILFGVNATMKDYLIKVLSKSVEGGWGVDKTVRQLNEFSEIQAARIVRTEINSAANVGVSASESTYEYQTQKEWIAIMDSRVRGTDPEDHASHRALNGTVIDFEDFFIDPRNGDRLRQPGDPKASAGSIINCRCQLTLKPKKDINGRLIPKGGSVSGGFSPAKTWEEAFRFMRDNTLSYEVTGAGKASLETLNAVNKALYNSKQKHGIIYDKIIFNKTRPSKFFEPAKDLTIVEDGLLVEHRLHINQGHIDWAIEKHGSLESFLSKDNWFAAENLEGIIHHEYGHRVTKGMFNSKTEYLKWNKSVDKFRIDVSGYGKTHGEEALAEIWAIYSTKGKAALKAEYIDFFNSHSPKYKIKQWQMAY